MNNFLNNFNNLTVREKIIFGIGGAIIFVFLYLGIFIFPSLEKIKILKKQTASLSKDWVEMQKLAETYENLPKQAPSPERASLLPYLEETGRTLKIDKKIVYLKPFSTTSKSEGAEMKIDDISGEDTVKFLFKLKEARIKILKMNLRDHNIDGLWTVKVFLEG